MNASSNVTEATFLIVYPFQNTAVTTVIAPDVIASGAVVMAFWCSRQVTI